MTDKLRQKLPVPAGSTGQRFDQVAAQMFPQYSRARLQAWIRSGELILAGRAVKPNVRILGHETVELSATSPAVDRWEAQAIELDIVYEDESLLVINKPAGLVVHPAAGNPDGTLLNAVLHHAPQLEAVPRAGIVHRLDKDTTGLLVVAKTLEAQTSLVRQLQARTVGREYQAVVQGVVPTSGRIETLIGRHPTQRVKMAVVDANGKPAVTHFTATQFFSDYTLVRVKLETGRTHQIRVHMAHLGHPLIGDPLYRRKARPGKAEATAVADAVQRFPRQALHAAQLRLMHPDTDCELGWRAPMPKDMKELLGVLEQHASAPVDGQK